MDPNAALHDLIDAAASGDALGLMQAANALAQWLDKGGFPPTDPRS